jgi:dihydrofolate reductase
MRLVVNLQISVDGVVQANGGNNQEIDPGMTRGGWASPHFDDESMAFLNDFYQRAEAFLFGRRTYDLFAGYWGARDDMDNPIVNALNTKPKYVVSNSITEPQWANTTVISGDIAAHISELKAKPGGELQVHGSVVLTQWLLENNLIDELNLLVCPVIVGMGKRLFPEKGPDMALKLIKSQAFPKGIVLQVYQPAGRPEYA